MYSDTVPPCDAIKKRGRCTKDRGKILWGRANCMDLFELREEFLKTGCFKFKVTSWCMFPVLKKGDMLNVEYAGAEDMKAGDVPAYRSGDKLYAHRIVGKKVIDGKNYIITRPDGGSDANDAVRGEKISEEDILGRVKEIRRGKKSFSAERRKISGWDRLLYKKTELETKSIKFFLNTFNKTFAKIQSAGLYGYIAAKLGKKFKHNINFQLATPHQGRLKTYEYTSLEKKKIDIPDLKKYKDFHILMKLKNTPVGCATFLNRPPSCPHKGLWLADVYIRIRYRQMGFEAILTRRAKEFARRSSGLFF